MQSLAPVINRNPLIAKTSLNVVRNPLKITKLPKKSFIRTNNRLKKLKNEDNIVIDESYKPLLSRYINSQRCNVTVWGSSLAELEIKIDYISYLRSKKRFLRKFSGIFWNIYGKNEVFENKQFTPNWYQLFSLRPQLTGCDLLINSPINSGKTFLYLLPHLYYHHVTSSGNFYSNTTKNSNDEQILKDRDKLVVLIPTIDLVFEDSRSCQGFLGKFKKISSLLYRDLISDNLESVLDSDILYSTPKTFLKFLVKYPEFCPKIRFLVIDESERMISGEFGYLLARIRSLLCEDVQFIFLSNYGDELVKQFIFRFSKLNFKILSFFPNISSSYNNKENNKELTRHIYGPIRSVNEYEKTYNFVNSKNYLENCENPLELRVMENLKDILKNSEKPPKNLNVQFVLYEPELFVDSLLNELNLKKKTLVYFPTVKMCQFCYIFFKHYHPFFSFINSNNYNNSNNFNSSTDSSICVNNTNNNNNKEEKFIFYSFHKGLSLEKRRFVLDTFKDCKKGILFCTNLSIGLNFNPDKIIQISFSTTITEFLNRFQYNYYVNSNNNINNIENNNNKYNNSNNKEIERVLLLNSLDGHILYIYYKNQINVYLKHVYSCITPSYGSSKDNSSNNCFNGIYNNNIFSWIYYEKIINIKQNREIYFLNSGELMYRSLLGFYSQYSDLLKIERWTIPSFFNEFLKSFGIKENFKVSKQFANRTKLVHSPGLDMDKDFNKKSSLISSLRAYPRFNSKLNQSKTLFLQ